MSKKKQVKGLGRGLGAIFTDMHEEETTTDQLGKVVDIPLDKISPNPRQPRKAFDLEKLKELADTIATYGVIQPVVVQKSDDGYILIAGERRVRASEMAGMSQIPAIIKDYSSSEIMEITLVENLQREDLNPIEEALAYQQLIDEFGLTQENLAKRLGKSRSAITNSLRLLTLDDELKHYVVDGQLSAGQMRPMLVLESLEEQKSLAQSAVKNQWSARKIESIVQKLKSQKKETDAPLDEPKTLQQLLLKDIEEQIRRHYGTKVSIKQGSREGKIELSFYGEDDLERLVNLMLKEEE